MNEYILQAFVGIPGQLEAQPDSLCLRIAGAPSGLHALDAPLGNLCPNDRPPLGAEVSNPIHESRTVPAHQHLQASMSIRIRSNA
jgi:hypothetical protein